MEVKYTTFRELIAYEFEVPPGRAEAARDIVDHMTAIGAYDCTVTSDSTIEIMWKRKDEPESDLVKLIEKELTDRICKPH